MMGSADTFHITYTFSMEYHGVVEQLDAIMELCDDRDIINSLDCQALEEERILVYEVLKKLDKTIKKVKQRNQR